MALSYRLIDGHDRHVLLPGGLEGDQVSLTRMGPGGPEEQDHGTAPLFLKRDHASLLVEEMKVDRARGKTREHRDKDEEEQG